MPRSLRRGWDPSNWSGDQSQVLRHYQVLSTTRDSGLLSRFHSTQSGWHMSSSLLAPDNSTVAKSSTLSTRLLTTANKRERTPRVPSSHQQQQQQIVATVFILPFQSLTGGSSVPSLILHQKVWLTSQLIAPDTSKLATKTSWWCKTASGQKRRSLLSFCVDLFLWLSFTFDPKMRYDERVHAINNIRDVDNKLVSTSMICCIFSFFLGQLYKWQIMKNNNHKI